MKDLHLRRLKCDKFNKRICWTDAEGRDRRIVFETMPFFYILPKLGFRCENKKLQYIVFGWMFWELSFYRDVYANHTAIDNECDTQEANKISE